MASQLDAQYELNKAADRKTKRAEADLLDVEQKLRQMECSGSLPGHNAVLLEQDKVSRTSYTRRRTVAEPGGCFHRRLFDCLHLHLLSSNMQDKTN